MKHLKICLVIVVAILLQACSAGVNFVKPADDKIILGVTTKDQIIALMGEPNGRGHKISNGENLELITYAYAKLGDEPVFDGVTPARSIGFLFHNNILVGKNYTSSFKSDNTYFDPAKAKSIKQGMKASEVLAIMGKPGGEYRYPVIENKNGKALVYTFVQTIGFKSKQQILIVELDENGIVQKSEYQQLGQI